MIRVMTSKDATAPYIYDKCDNDGYIISGELQDKVKITDTKSGSYVIEPQFVETSRIKTQDYIDSFKDQVGIENILKRFNLVNDPELFNQVYRPSVPIAEDGKEVVQDYSNLPNSMEEATEIAKKGMAAYKSLPADLVNNRSFMEFAESCSEEELNAYIAAIKKGDKKDE